MLLWLSTNLAAPEGRVIGGEVAVRDPEVPLQLDGMWIGAGSRRRSARQAFDIPETRGVTQRRLFTPNRRPKTMATVIKGVRDQQHEEFILDAPDFFDDEDEPEEIGDAKRKAKDDLIVDKDEDVDDGRDAVPGLSGILCLRSW